MTDLRHFLDILEGTPDQVRTKLLTHSGHDSVSVLLADIPHANNVLAEAAHITIRRVTEALTLGHHQLGPASACPVCDTRGNAPESLEQGLIRCTAGGARAFIHAGLITCLQKVLQEAGVHTSVTLTEACDRCGGEDMTRHGDILWFWTTMHREGTF